MAQISNSYKSHQKDCGDDTPLVIAPYSVGKIAVDKGDLVAGDVVNLPAGGFEIWVANQGIQGVVTVEYDGNIIPLTVGQYWSEIYTEIASTQTTYLLKEIKITVGAGSEGTYTFRYPQ